MEQVEQDEKKESGGDEEKKQEKDKEEESKAENPLDKYMKMVLKAREKQQTKVNIMHMAFLTVDLWLLAWLFAFFVLFFRVL